MQLKEELLENTSNKDCDDLVKGKMGMSQVIERYQEGLRQFLSRTSFFVWEMEGQ